MNPHCCKVESKYKPVTHVIFDLDGTILDTENIYNGVISDIAKEYGKTITDSMKKEFGGRLAVDVCNYLIQELDLSVSLDELLNKFMEEAAKYFSTCDYLPGAKELITHLYDHHIPLAIATSSYQESVIMKFQYKQDIYKMFHHIVCGGTDAEVTQGKPAPDIFLICASRFPDRPAPSKCLVFEDSVNGVKAALNAGMQVVMIPDKFVPYEDWKMATLRLDTLEFMLPQLFDLPPFQDRSDKDITKHSIHLGELSEMFDPGSLDASLSYDGNPGKEE